LPAVEKLACKYKFFAAEECKVYASQLVVMKITRCCLRKTRLSARTRHRLIARRDLTSLLPKRGCPFLAERLAPILHHPEAEYRCLEPATQNAALAPAPAPAPVLLSSTLHLHTESTKPPSALTSPFLLEPTASPDLETTADLQQSRVLTTDSSRARVDPGPEMLRELEKVQSRESFGWICEFSFCLLKFVDQFLSSTLLVGNKSFHLQ
jgi:hypothetical protein